MEEQSEILNFRAEKARQKKFQQDAERKKQEAAEKKQQEAQKKKEERDQERKKKKEEQDEWLRTPKGKATSWVKGLKSLADKCELARSKRRRCLAEWESRLPKSTQPACCTIGRQ